MLAGAAGEAGRELETLRPLSRPGSRAWGRGCSVRLSGGPGACGARRPGGAQGCARVRCMSPPPPPRHLVGPGLLVQRARRASWGSTSALCPLTLGPSAAPQRKESTVPTAWALLRPRRWSSPVRYPQRPSCPGALSGTTAGCLSPPECPPRAGCPSPVGAHSPWVLIPCGCLSPVGTASHGHRQTPGPLQKATPVSRAPGRAAGLHPLLSSQVTY